MAEETEPLLIPDIARKVGSIVVFTPRALMRDAARVRRLDQYLAAAFPNQRFIVTGQSREKDDGNVAAGFLTETEGPPPMPDAAGQALIREVLEAVAHFVEHGGRLH